MPPSRIGLAVRSARTRVGWSREALAYHSGLSMAAISQIESGRRQEVRLSSLVALAEALVVSVDYLVGVSVVPHLLQHRAGIYQSDEEYVALAAPFLREGIARTECVVAVTAPRHTGLLRAALGEAAGSVEFHDATEWYGSLDNAANGYRALLRDRFDCGSPWIRIVAEPVWTGRSTAELVEWIRYESLINLALASSPATIVCTYDTRAVPDTVIAGARHTHPEMAQGGASAATMNEYQEPENFLLNM